MSVCVVDGDFVTAYGIGLDACWQGLLAGQSAVKPFSRFTTDPFQCHCAAVLDGLSYRDGPSIVWQMIEQLLSQNDPRIPADAPILFASTTGEVDLLEQSVDAGQADCSESRLVVLLKKICSRLNGSLVGQASCIQEPVLSPKQNTPSRIRDSNEEREASLLRGNDQREWQRRPTTRKQKSAVVSSACASATVALAQGAAMIESGESDCVAVVACDAVTEFVFSGFASLMALDPQGARPFDAERQGLSVGEAAGFAVLMSHERAAKEGRKVLGELAGWGMSNDANHMTGPSRDGGSLAAAIRRALRRAEIEAADVAMICAHGTGTKYNDAMELKAFRTVFEHPPPVFSVKGGTGHTMGAAGLLEALLTLRAQREKCVPPTVGFQRADDEAAGVVSSDVRVPERAEWALSTNSGFGGVNAALVLRRAVS